MACATAVLVALSLAKLQFRNTHVVLAVLLIIFKTSVLMGLFSRDRLAARASTLPLNEPLLQRHYVQLARLLQLWSQLGYLHFNL